MSVHAPARVTAPGPPAPPRRQPSPLHAAERQRRVARLHLVTYLLGNAVFWSLWAAVSISADHWYWWPIVPFVGWTAVLAVHLWRVRE